MQCLPSRIWRSKICAEKHDELSGRWGMSNHAVPVPVVQSCTLRIQSSTKVNELQMGGEIGGRKTRMLIYPGFVG